MNLNGISILVTGILAVFAMLGGFASYIGSGPQNFIVGYCLMFIMVMFARSEMRQRDALKRVR